MAAYLMPLIPAAVALLLACAAWIRADAAHRKASKVEASTADKAVLTVRQTPAKMRGDKE